MAKISESVVAPASFTMTFDGIANSSVTGAASAAIIPTTVPLDELVTAQIVVSTAAAGSDKAIYIYTYGLIAPSTTYTDNVPAGGSTGFTRSDPANLQFLGMVSVPGGSTTFNVLMAGPFSIAQTFGGNLPAQYGIFANNFSGNVAGTSCVFYHQAVFGNVGG